MDVTTEWTNKPFDAMVKRLTNGDSVHDSSNITFVIVSMYVWIYTEKKTMIYFPEYHHEASI